MNFMKCSITIFAVVSISCGVKVNLQGSLSFGKDVLDSLSNYMRRSMPMRRSFGSFGNNEADVFLLITKSTYLCRELPLCEGKLEIFLNEYITVLTKGVETVFQTIIGQGYKKMNQNRISQHLFEDELKKILHDVRDLLRSANLKVTEKTEAYVWVDIVKKISAMFQEAAIVYATDRLDDKTDDFVVIQKKLMQKFVVATIVVESKYEHMLCSEYNICSTSYECTQGLHTLLGALLSLDGEKLKVFFRYFAEELLDTTFYSHISKTTANEFQEILNDMGYSNVVPTKEVLTTIYKIVEDRLMALKSKSHYVAAKDGELVQVILSDLDHFYSKRKRDPFHAFLSNIFEWIRLNSKIRTPIREAFRMIGDHVIHMSEELQVKLIHEIRAFLEITVDPAK